MVFEKPTSLDDDRLQISECDRCILHLLHQALMEADSGADSGTDGFGTEEDCLGPFQQFFEKVGLLVVSVEGGIQSLTHRASDLLKQYTVFEDASTLPELLLHWFKYQVFLSIPPEENKLLGWFLYIEQGERQLVARLFCCGDRHHYLLLLEEQPVHEFSVESLELLGLTPREAEVLFGVAKDKSNAELAAMLGCCEGTVRKHMESIHRKLGVRTRTGAVMSALERLGLLQTACITTSS